MQDIDPDNHHSWPPAKKKKKKQINVDAGLVAILIGFIGILILILGGIQVSRTSPGKKQP